MSSPPQAWKKMIEQQPTSLKEIMTEQLIEQSNAKSEPWNPDNDASLEEQVTHFQTVRQRNNSTNSVTLYDDSELNLNCKIQSQVDKIHWQQESSQRKNSAHEQHHGAWSRMLKSARYRTSKVTV
jgi:chromatin segregation and condensation protein Rec8/ScpA/Scc1 (kleisin family)